MFTDLKPIITETTMEMAKRNWFTFGASQDKNKNELRKLIEMTFKVNVISIKTLNVKGKEKRSLRSRKLTKTSSWKKVMVKIKEGQKIDIFEIQQ